jgi:polar amino acid transport system permease protein
MSYSPEQFVHPPTGRPGKTERDNELESFIDFAINSLPALLKGTLVTLELWVICIFWGTLLGLFLSLCRVYGRGAVYIGIVLRPIVAASISIALNTAAYQAEYFRGAILSVEPGQMAAARSLGMSKLKAVRKIILPQALRLAIPQWSNEVILELKMTSIAFAIGVSELMAQAKAIGFRTFRYIEIFMLAAIIYLIIVSFFSTLLDIAERKLKIPGLEIG